VIIGVGVDPVVQQVAVVIPGVGDPVHARQPVGDVVLVGSRASGGRLRQLVANRIVDVKVKARCDDY